MDILHLVDRLEEVVNAGTAIPLSRKLMVDEERVLEIIDQMRVTIPEEVKRAQQVLAQRDRVLAQAAEEAQRTVQLAKEKAEQMVSREAIAQSAEARAGSLIQAAKADAETIRSAADDYTIEVLTKLEAELVKSLTQARNGIAKLRAERGMEAVASEP
jgi:cell division septum initiation protein DivIVA